MQQRPELSLRVFQCVSAARPSRSYVHLTELRDRLEERTSGQDLLPALHLQLQILCLRGRGRGDICMFSHLHKFSAIATQPKL